MKATLILTALLGAAVASPVAIASVEATQTEKRDIEPRLLPAAALATLLPNGGSLTNLSLPGLPTGAVTKDNIIETLADILRGVLAAILNIREGLPGNLALPTTPAVPNVPGPSVAADKITPEQLEALIAAIETQVKAATGVTQKLPTGLNLLQLQQIAAVVTTIKTQVSGLSTALSAVPSLPGGTPGASFPGVNGLSTVTASLSPILSTLSSLLGPLLFGLIGVLSGGLLSSLPGGR